MAFVSLPARAPNAEDPVGGDEERWLLVGASALVLSVVWLRPGAAILSGTDDGCYAAIARRLMESGAWLAPSWRGGEPFIDHPPLALWLEAVAFRLFGATTPVAVTLGRAWASLLVSGACAVAWSLGGRRAAALAAVGLCTLPAFLSSSQHAMFDVPLGACVTWAVWAVLRAAERPVGSAALFSGCVVAGLFIKGPPVLAAFGVLALATALRLVPWRRGLALGVAGALALIAALGLHEAVRARAGLGPFWSAYFAHQVAPSFSEGRGNFAGPFYFLAVLRDWYLPGLLVLPLALAGARRDARARALLQLGLGLWVLVVLGFSLARKKYGWYLDAGWAGPAWCFAAAASALPERVWPWLGRACAATALGWALFVVTGVEGRPTQRGRLLATFERSTAPAFPAGQPRTVGYCGQLDSWLATHLIDFLWDAQWVGCEAPASVCFDDARTWTRAPPAACQGP